MEESGGARARPSIQKVHTNYSGLLQRREGWEGLAVPHSPPRGREKEEGVIAYYRMCAMNASRLKYSLEVFCVVVWQRGGKNGSFGFLFRVRGVVLLARSTDCFPWPNTRQLQVVE